MKGTLVLSVGYPGTGKFYLMRQIQEMYPTFQTLPPGAYKEEMWGRCGFDTVEEKGADIQRAWVEYYRDMEDVTQMDISIPSNCPFSDKQENGLGQLVATHAYQIVIMRLVTDLDILYEHQKARDLDDIRHPGHIVGSLHEGNTLQGRDEQPCMIGYEKFMNRCKSRGYRAFALGTVLELDVADFSHADHPVPMQSLNRILR